MIFKGFRVTISALALCGSMAVLADDAAIYQERWDAFLKAPGQVSFGPLEDVAGATGPGLPRLARPTIPAAALSEADTYAAANKSSTLIVWRKGKIEFERYYGNRTADSLLVSKSMAKPITAIAVGRAIRLGYIKSLDQSVADFVTEWRGTPKAAIKIRYLLDMRSGMLEQGFSPIQTIRLTAPTSIPIMGAISSITTHSWRRPAASTVMPMRRASWFRW